MTKSSPLFKRLPPILLTVKFILIVAFYAVFIFFYPILFNYEVGISQSYYLLFYSFSFLLFNNLSGIFGQYKYSSTELLMWFSFYVLSFYYLIYPGQSYCNEYFVDVFCIFGVILTVTEFDHNTHIKLWFSIFMFFVVQVVIGVLQLSHAFNDSAKAAVGSFGNSGLYSIYLSVHIPLCFFYWQFRKKYPSLSGLILYILPLIVCFCVAIVIINGSRTSLLFLFGYSLFIISRNLNQISSYLKARTFGNFSAIVSIISVVSFLMITLISLMYQKNLSAVGRLVSYKVVKNHLGDFFWTGVGLGKLSLYYPLWQAEYYANILNSFPIDEFLAGGETYIIFNEYFILFKELGIVGFITFVFVIGTFFVKKTTDGSLIFALKGVLAGILFCGMFYYTLHVGTLLFIVMFVLIAGYKFNPSMYVRRSKFHSISLHSFKYINCSLAFILFLLLIRLQLDVSKWKNLNSEFYTSKINRKLVYEKLSTSTFKNDGKFQIEYGEFLAQDRLTLTKASIALKRGNQLYFSYRGIEDLAIVYENLDSFSAALHNYSLLSNYIPNRFLPRSKMIKLHLKLGDTAKAMNMARFVLSMPVKIPSEAVDRIKSEAARVVKLE